MGSSVNVAVTSMEISPVSDEDLSKKLQANNETNKNTRRNTDLRFIIHYLQLVADYSSTSFGGQYATNNEGKRMGTSARKCMKTAD
jgi:hypothetical protein